MSENDENALNQKNNNIYFFNKYKMFQISAETYTKNCVHTIKLNKKPDKDIHCG